MAEGLDPDAPHPPQESVADPLNLDDPDSTLDKIACIEEMINRFETNGPWPSDVFLQNVLAQVNKEELYGMVSTQKHM